MPTSSLARAAAKDRAAQAKAQAARAAFLAELRTARKTQTLRALAAETGLSHQRIAQLLAT